MNSDLINRSALLESIGRTRCKSKRLIEGIVLDGVMAIIAGVPAVEAADVVRCKDCINRDQAFRCIALYYGFNPHDDWFCANGKRDAEVKHEHKTKHEAQGLPAGFEVERYALNVPPLQG